MKILHSFLFLLLFALACSPDLDDQPAAAGAGLQPVPDSLFQLASRQLDSLKFQAALELTGDTAWLADAFVFFEKSKSALLAASLREEQAETVAGIPAEVLRREQWLKSQCAHLRQRWQNPDPISDLGFRISDLQGRPNKSEIPNPKSEIEYFQARRQLDSLVGKLEKNYPDYFRRKYDLGVASLEAVQQRGICVRTGWDGSKIFFSGK